MKDDRDIRKSQGGRTRDKLATGHGKSRQTQCPSTRKQGVRFKVCGCGCRHGSKCVNTSMKMSWQRSVLESIAEDEAEYSDDEGEEYPGVPACYEVEKIEEVGDEHEYTRETGKIADDFWNAHNEGYTGAGETAGKDDAVDVGYDVKACEYVNEVQEADDSLWTWDGWYGVWTHSIKGSFEVAEEQDQEDEDKDFEFECDTVTSFALSTSESEHSLATLATEQSYVLPPRQGVLSRTMSLNTVGIEASFCAVEFEEVDESESEYQNVLGQPVEVVLEAKGEKKNEDGAGKETSLVLESKEDDGAD